MRIEDYKIEKDYDYFRCLYASYYCWVKDGEIISDFMSGYNQTCRWLDEHYGIESIYNGEVDLYLKAKTRDIVCRYPIFDKYRKNNNVISKADNIIDIKKYIV